MTDYVEVESAVVYDLTITDCPLCGADLTVDVWHVVGSAVRECTGCHKPVGPEHVICGECGCHVTKGVA